MMEALNTLKDLEKGKSSYLNSELDKETVQSVKPASTIVNAPPPIESTAPVIVSKFDLNTAKQHPIYVGSGLAVSQSMVALPSSSKIPIASNQPPKFTRAHGQGKGSRYVNLLNSEENQ